jgi:SH3-like domain-containing protein
VAGAVTVVFAINLAAIDLGIGVSEEAVVMVDEVAVHSAPSDDSSLQIFAIHEGTKIRVDRRSEEWVEVVLEDGKVGWDRYS